MRVRICSGRTSSDCQYAAIARFCYNRDSCLSTILLSNNSLGIETMIRKMTSQDIERVGDIWLETSIVAHDFVSADFWRTAHKTMTEELLPLAEGYVHVGGERIDGFTVIADDFIHCLFVEPKRQRGGIGTVLLSHLKESHQGLRLHTYQKNPGATRFYESHGFRITGEATCPHTGCAEFKMEWRKKPKPEN